MSKDEWIEKVRYWLKLLLFFVILVFVWLAFEDFFANLFNKFEGIISKENNGLLTILFAIICLLYLVYIGVKHYRQRVFSPYFFAILGFIIIVCLNYRFNWGLWKGDREINRDYHCFLDIVWGSLALLLIGSGSIVVFNWNKQRKKLKIKKEEIEKNSGRQSDLLSDEAKNSREQDEYNFTPHVEKFVEKITNWMNTKEESHSFGLLGDWGSGKSTYANLIKKKLKKKEEYIIVDFNPRHSKSIDHIQKDFFNLLETELEVYDMAISHSLNKYLSAIGVNNESKTISFFVDILGIMLDESNIEKRRQKVNDSIKKIGKRIVVFIDDFDRLLCKEILEVLKLIDVNAKFWNVVFISAYDKKQVEEIFYKEKIAQPDRFAEKFFNVEHHIPLPDKEYILDNLNKYLLLKN